MGSRKVTYSLLQVHYCFSIEFSQDYFRTELALSREADFGVAQIVPRYTFKGDRSLSELYVKTGRRRKLSGLQNLSLVANGT